MVSKSFLRLSQHRAPPNSSTSGATKGIGRAITLELSARGCSILGTYSSPSSAHLFDTIDHTITSLFNDAPERPKFVGLDADITSSSAPSLILEALRKNFNGKIDIVVFNAAVMGLAKMGDGTVTQQFVEKALAGNIQFPVLLMETFVAKNCIRENGRVVAISSEGVRARRPGGG